MSGREVDPGKIVYAWARGASDFEAGEDTGFVVGTRAGINAAHIVLQTHFLKPSSEETENDVGEIEMRFSTKFPSKVLSMDLFANSRFRLPPKLESVDVKAKCCMQGGQSANGLGDPTNQVHRRPAKVSRVINQQARLLSLLVQHHLPGQGCR